jgi:hypothetical protein
MRKDKARKIRTPEQLAARRAREIDLPAAQIARGDLKLAPVANWSDEDQRHMVRSRERTTVRRLGRIEKLRAAGTIDGHEAQACDWYAAQHALGYDTIGCTTNYSGIRGRDFRSADLFARYRAQAEARANFAFARAALPAHLLPMFEAIVLDGKTMADAGMGLYEQLGRSQRAAKLRAAFRLAANLLHGRIVHVLPAE